MPKVNKFVGVLAMSAALTGGAVALGTAATTVAADAATVSAVQMQNPHAFVLKRKKKGAKKKNKNKQWQREQQHQKQNQFLLRDFTLVLTPFQKSENDSCSAVQLAVRPDAVDSVEPAALVRREREQAAGQAADQGEAGAGDRAGAGAPHAHDHSGHPDSGRHGDGHRFAHHLISRASVPARPMTRSAAPPHLSAGHRT